MPSEVHVLWLSGMSCDGCTASVTSSQNPSLEDLMLGRIPETPIVRLHHPAFAEASGADFIEPFRLAVARRLGEYILVLEGSVPDDQALPGAGYYAAMGTGSVPGSDQPLRTTDWLKLLAPGASACIAIGTCACWGGIPAAAGNITGSMSLMDYLGPTYKSASGIPVINVPGCAPIGDNFTETLVEVLKHLDGQRPLPEFDELGRPAWQFGETVHRHCPKAGYYEEGVFAEEYGDNECLVEVGCWGPVVQCNIVERGAVNHMGGCMVAGGPCIGCTMPGFPDKFSPFYKAAPGSAISGTIARIQGTAIRNLRQLSIRGGNREPLWDNTEDVPSPWARAHFERTAVEKAVVHFYKNLQYAGTANHASRYKTQPTPKSLDILRKNGVDLDASVPVLRERVKSREEL